MSKDTLLATALRVLRESRSISQKELAELSGIERNTISKYENGWIQPSREKLRTLLESLRLSYADLEEAESFVRRLRGAAPAAGDSLTPVAAARPQQIRQVAEELGRNLGTLLEMVVQPPTATADESRDG
jgi:transcriptional regulator with XRE-family HTH domain